MSTRPNLFLRIYINYTYFEWIVVSVLLKHSGPLAPLPRVLLSTSLACTERASDRNPSAVGEGSALCKHVITRVHLDLDIKSHFEYVYLDSSGLVHSRLRLWNLARSVASQAISSTTLQIMSSFGKTDLKSSLKNWRSFARNALRSFYMLLCYSKNSMLRILCYSMLYATLC